jgi:hypothetical protein
MRNKNRVSTENLSLMPLTEDVVDDTFADMARHAMLLLVGRGMTIPPEHRRKPRRTEEPNIVVMVSVSSFLCDTT